jgi:hypothetical protein
MNTDFDDRSPVHQFLSGGVCNQKHTVIVDATTPEERSRLADKRASEKNQSIKQEIASK